MMQDYKIKPGYRPNLVQGTLDTPGGGPYWSAERRASARVYQYYVYLHAARRLARQSTLPAVMDVGCGYPWKFARMIRPVAGRQLLVDQPSTASMVRELCPGADFLGMDLERIDRELPERFDLVICADVLEHLVNPDPCVAFIRRHLSASGLAMLSTPERDFLRGPDCDYCPKREHVREWNSGEFSAYLHSRGFTISEQRWFPQRQLTRFEYVLSRAIGPRRWPRRWASCQMAVCRANALADKIMLEPSGAGQRPENP